MHVKNVTRTLHYKSMSAMYKISLNRDKSIMILTGHLTYYVKLHLPSI